LRTSRAGIRTPCAARISALRTYIIGPPGGNLKG
jgi:hypothetical protein